MARGLYRYSDHQDPDANHEWYGSNTRGPKASVLSRQLGLEFQAVSTRLVGDKPLQSRRQKSPGVVKVKSVGLTPWPGMPYACRLTAPNVAGCCTIRAEHCHARVRSRRRKLLLLILRPVHCSHIIQHIWLLCTRPYTLVYCLLA